MSEQRNRPKPLGFGFEAAIDNARFGLSVVEAEQGLLGAALVNNRAFVKTCTIVRSADFYDPLHARIWQAISDLSDQGSTADPVLVNTRMGQDPDFSEAGGLDYLFGLAGNVVSPLNAEHYARLIAEKAEQRRIVEAAAGVIRMAVEPGGEKSADELASQAVTAFQTVGRSDLLRTRQDVVDQVIRRADRPPACYPTGLQDLDRGMEGGLFAGWTYGFAAAEKIGKTTLGRTISGNLNRAGVRHVYVALEMGSEQIEEAQLARELGFNAIAWRRGLTPERVSQVLRHAGTAPDNVAYVDRPGATDGDVMRALSQAQVRHRATGAIIDYLQLIGGRDRHDSEEQHLRRVAQALADFGRRTGMWILVLAQLHAENGRVFGGSGLTKACDQLYFLRETEDGRGHWLEMRATRYTTKGNLGGPNDPVLELDMRGPHFREFAAPAGPDVGAELALEGV